MSRMNYLDKLLDGVAVELRPLDELIHSLKTGLNPRQNFQLNTINAENYYVTVREIQDGKIFFLDKTDRINDEALKIINGRSNLEVGDILFSGTGTVGRTAVISATPSNWNIKEGVYSIKPNSKIINSKFLCYLLNSTELIKEYSKKIVGSPVISLPMGDLRKIKIPIPCPENPEKSLEIQAEIVRILDAMTAHTAELTAELTLRQKQYNYYRDKLLIFEDGEMEWKTLGEITISIAAGRNKHRDSEGEYPVYGSTGIIGFTDEVAYSGNMLLVARVGAYAGLVNLVSGKFDVSDNTLILRPSKEWNVRFAFHQLINMNLNQYAVGAGQPLLTGGLLKSLKVPFPSLEKQIKISEALDKFDALTTSITEGLPREIELRQKQYEYYRDALLSFPKPNNINE